MISLTFLSSTEYTIAHILVILLGIILFLTGAWASKTNIKHIKIMKAIATAWLFGNLAFQIGLASAPRDSTYNRTFWIIAAASVILAIVFARLSNIKPNIGNRALAASSARCLWMLFSEYVTNQIASLVVSLVLAFIGVGLSKKFPQPMKIISCSLIGGVFLIFGPVYIIANCLLLAGLSDSQFHLGNLTLYIIGDVLAIIAVGVNLYVHYNSKNLNDGSLDKEAIAEEEIKLSNTELIQV